MSSIHNYRGGDVQAVAFPTDYADATPSTAYPIQIGDLLYVHQSSPYFPVRSAQYLPSYGTEAQAQKAFKDYFAGVAMRKTGQQTQTGYTESLWHLQSTIDPGYTLVATTGIFEFACNLHTWSPGDLVGIYCGSNGTIGGTLLSAPTDNTGLIPGGYSQQVDTAADVNSAIGVAVVPFNALNVAVTRVMVDIRSTTLYRSLYAPTENYGVGSGQ